jgi:hypothetical protein
MNSPHNAETNSPVELGSLVREFLARLSHTLLASAKSTEVLDGLRDGLQMQQRKAAKRSARHGHF